MISDRYEITQHLGTGGFASVFQAFDQLIERGVAIKFLDPSLMTEGEEGQTNVERFEREAKFAAKLQHPNVVNIFDIGSIEAGSVDVPFIVMELMEGVDLAEYIEENGAMDPTRFIPLFIDCLEALGEAHNRGIVHKDLKPENVFFVRADQRSELLQILDFGVAHIKTGGDAKRLTQAGQVLGTPQYLAPEYVEKNLVTPALDVYQMGLVLVEALAGAAALEESNSLQCIRAHSAGDIPVPVPLVESPLGPVLFKSLATDPDERYQQATEMADGLAKVEPSQVPEIGSDFSKKLLSEITPGSEGVVPAQTGETLQDIPTDSEDEESTADSGDAAEADKSDGAPWEDRSPDTLEQIGETTAQEALQEQEDEGSSMWIYVSVAAAVLLVAAGAWFWTQSTSSTQPKSGGPTAAGGGQDVKNAVAAAAEARAVSVSKAGSRSVMYGALGAAAVDAKKLLKKKRAEKEEKSEPDRQPTRNRQAAKPVHVKLRSNVDSATVYENGRQVGKTPVRLTFKNRNAGARQLTIKRSNYDTKKVRISPGDAPGRLVSLSRAKPEPKEKPKPEPENKPEQKPEKKPKQKEPSEDKKEDEGGGMRMIPD